MVFIYLGTLALFILFCVIVYIVVRKLFKWIDKLEVGEKMADIKHDADLVKDVRDFKDKNSDAITDSESTIVKDFL